MSSFVGWLRQQRRRDDPVGDVARDVIEDRRIRCMESGVRGVRAVRGHLFQAHGVDEYSPAGAAFERAVGEFKQEQVS